MVVVGAPPRRAPPRSGPPQLARAQPGRAAPAAVSGGARPSGGELRTLRGDTTLQQGPSISCRMAGFLAELNLRLRREGCKRHRISH